MPGKTIWLSTPMWRLQLAVRLRRRARFQPGLTEEQRREALRHAQNLVAIHQRRMRDQPSVAASGAARSNGP